MVSFPPTRSPNEDYPEPTDEADARASKTGFKAARRNQWLPYLHEALSPEEAIELVDWVRTALVSPAAARRNAGGLLGLMQVTGLPLELVLSSPVSDASSNSAFTPEGTWRKKILREPRAWTAQLAQLPLLRRWTNRVTFDMPIELKRWLHAVTRGGMHTTLSHALKLDLKTADTMVREALQIVRTQRGGHQTLGRVQHWLSMAVHRASHDHVVAHLVAATPADPPQASAYYRAYPSTSLESVHRQALDSAGWRFDDVQAGRNDVDAWVGSQLNPEPESMRQLWRDARTSLQASINDASLPFYERFNAHQILSVMQLMFIGGIRCVRDPVESIFDFSVIDALGVVDDKNQGQDRAHRVIVLSSLFAEQLDVQRDHLARLVTRLRPITPHLAERIRLGLTDPRAHVLPLFFLLSEHGRPRSIQPKDLKEALHEVWPLPFNLGRHYLATECLRREVGDLPTSSFLGHVDVGTQNLSILSPVAPEDLYGELKGVLDSVVKDLNLQAVPSFLIEPAADLDSPVLPRGKRPGGLNYGRAARAAARQRFLHRVRHEAIEWVNEQLGGRNESELSQEHVDRLFETARKASPNARTYASFSRFEQLRAHLVNIIESHDLNIELPAIAIPILDHALICPIDAPQAAAWLRTLRRGIRGAWQKDFDAWRSSRGEPYSPNLALLALTLIVECSVTDYQVWIAGAASDGGSRPAYRHPAAMLCRNGEYNIRFDIGGDNSRLYPTPRMLGLILGRAALDKLVVFDHKTIVNLARDLSPDSNWSASECLQGLLSRVDSGMTLYAPGLVVGYANGSHASVSPSDACLERMGGKTPRVDTMARWRAKTEAGRRLRDAELAEAIRTAAVDVDRHKLLDRCLAETGEGMMDTGRLFRAVAKAFRAGTRRTGKRKAKANPKPTDQLVDKPSGDHEGTLRQRFIDELESGFVKLAESGARLPPTCVQVGDWLLGSAKDGYGPNRHYVIKTLRNLWHSWGRLLAREGSAYRLEALEPAELVAVYVDIVSASKANKRAHIYPLIRSFHHFLMEHHGASGIDWTTVSRSCGVGPGRVDANLVHEHEYFEALNLLYEDKRLDDARKACANAACLVLLYRGGLRIDEVTGLRNSDLVQLSGRWFIRVGRNIYRNVKSDAGVRRVPLLEALTPFEEKIVAEWRDHVDSYLDHRHHYPLFTAEGNSAARLSMREVGQRIAHALRHVSGDPFVRVHHCRHAWATRMLKLLMEPRQAKRTEDSDGDDARVTAADAIRLLLTDQQNPTRRTLWAISELLGHGSPLQSLHSYAHSGHELLRAWISAKWWSSTPLIKLTAKDSDTDCELFAAGIVRRSWMRKVERAVKAKKPAPVFEAEEEMMGIVNLDEGLRAPKGKPLGRPGSTSRRQSRLFDIDRIIDHARQFEHVRGLSESLFVAPDWTEKVLLQARSVCRDSSGPSPSSEQAGWWLDASNTTYSAHERRQLRAAYRRLEKVPLDQYARQLDALVKQFEYDSGMFVVSDLDNARSAICILEFITGTRSAIEILIPAVKREGPQEPSKQGRNRDGGRRKERTSMLGVKKPRVESYTAQHGDHVWTSWQATAEQLGLQHRLHGDVPESRAGGRNAFERSLRVGIRVKENGELEVRSAKVGARLFAVFVVASRVRHSSPTAKVRAVLD